MNSPPPLLLSCSILREEIQALRRAGRLDCPVQFVESMLHIHPERLDQVLAVELAAARARGESVALAYGDCSASMPDFSTDPAVTRTPCQNCCDLLLGREEFRRWRREGAFLLMPEWTRRWRNIFQKELGLNETNARDLMREMHTKLVYLDTGLVPVPEEELRACSEYCGLPYEVCRVSLDTLCQSLQQVLQPKSGTTHPPAT